MPWFPRDRYIWDFWFAEQGEQLHLFYLQAPQAQCFYNPDLRHDAATIGHAVQTPWGWQEVQRDEPVLVASDRPGAWDSLSIWTGSIIQHPDSGEYVLFYTSRDRAAPLLWTPQELQRPQQIGLATSTDLNRWQRYGDEPSLPNPGGEPFDGVAWRDPYLLADAAGNFHAFICARLAGTTVGGGAIARVSSDRLDRWDSPPQLFFTSQEFYQLEVPQVFWRASGDSKRLYLLFSARLADCAASRYQSQPPEQCVTGTYYCVSEPVPLSSETWPPLSEPAQLLAANRYAGKLLRPERETEPLFFGFDWANATGEFGNGLAEPQRCRFVADGRLQLVPAAL